MTWKVTYSIFFLIYNEYGNLFIYFDFFMNAEWRDLWESSISQRRVISIVLFRPDKHRFCIWRML